MLTVVLEYPLGSGSLPLILGSWEHSGATPLTAPQSDALNFQKSTGDVHLSNAAPPRILCDLKAANQDEDEDTAAAATTTAPTVRPHDITSRIRWWMRTPVETDYALDASTVTKPFSPDKAIY